ncbi:MAG: serine/threonine protein kinase, partial [Pirellula sp.]
MNEANSEQTLPFRAKTRFSNPELLGIGAFGIVFSVRDELLGMDVAIKMLRPSKSRSKELRNRFIDEAQLTASLSHSNIVRFFETGQIDGIPYISYDKFNGGTLADLIANTTKSSSQRRLTARQSAWIVLRIADAVHFAHTKAILHRDLKPSNVLLKSCELERSEQLGFEPMLTDFGLAKRLNPSLTANNQTLDGRVLGTVRYMSPEQAKGAVSQIGTTSEVFSIGVILYQLLVGKVPFDDPFDLKVRSMICEQEPKRPRLMVPSIQSDLEAITLKCLAKEPSARYQSANELKIELERYLRGEPVLAKKSTAFRRWLYRCRRNPILTSVLVLAVAINCCALLGLTLSLLNERAAKQRERDALLALSSIHTEFADDIFAGKRIKDKIMLELSESMLDVFDNYIRQNPNDETVLHRISVLKHYKSMAIQRFGTPEQYVAIRSEVLDTITRLCDANPENEKYQFQKFHAKLLLGSELCAIPRLVPATAKMSGMDLLNSALKDIEKLATEHPNRIEYLDALAATKINCSNRLLSVENYEYRRQLLRDAATISEKLWNDHADRPILAKHAVDGYATLAKLERSESMNEEALILINRANDLCEKAWSRLEDEAWVLEESYRLWMTRAEILAVNNMHAEAIKVFSEVDRISEQLRSQSPTQIGRILPQIYNCQNHRDLLIKIGDLEAAEAVEENIILIINESAPNPT